MVTRVIWDLTSRALFNSMASRPNMFNNMASRPKRTLHKVRRFVDEFVVSDVKESVKKRPKKDNNLYEVEIKEVDRQNKRIRIHFKGYDARFDEWRPYDQDGEYFPFVRWEKPHVLTSSSLMYTIYKIYTMFRLCSLTCISCKYPSDQMFSLLSRHHFQRPILY